VAITVAGQQGISRPSPAPPHFGFWIADFGLVNLQPEADPPQAEKSKI
jgi:hypothetical protein